MDTPVITAIEQAEQGTSLWRDAWLRLRRNRLAVFGLAVLAFFVLIALLTPWNRTLRLCPATPRTRRHTALCCALAWH